MGHHQDTHRPLEHRNPLQLHDQGPGQVPWVLQEEACHGPAAVVVVKEIQLLEHLPYSLDLAPADFFLFRRVKEALAGIQLDQESLKNP